MLLPASGVDSTGQPTRNVNTEVQVAASGDVLTIAAGVPIGAYELEDTAVLQHLPRIRKNSKYGRRSGPSDRLYEPRKKLANRVLQGHPC